MRAPRFHAENAGHFFSSGRGRHPTRTIDSHELIYVVGGTLALFEEASSFRVEAGERLLLRPGRRHGGLTSYPRHLSFYWLHFRPANPEAERLIKRLPPHAAVDHADVFGAYWPALLAEQRLRSADPSLRGQVMDYLATILLMECAAPPPPASTPDVSRLADEAARFIRLRYADPISTVDIARHVHCHPDYLGRVFRAARGETLGDALRRARIDKACRLLKETKEAIKEIAATAGYDDVAYFRKQFRRECGMTPRRYRAMHVGGHVNTE